MIREIENNLKILLFSTLSKTRQKSKAEKPKATSLLKGSKEAEFVIRRRTASFAPSGYAGPGQFLKTF